jgi:phosphate uptake regulator
MDDLYLDDLAERLCAAAISFQVGNKSIDHTLKHDIRTREHEIGEYWRTLARQVHTHLMESRARNRGESVPDGSSA